MLRRIDKKTRSNGGDAPYDRLRAHLDRQAVGFPATRTGAEIRLLKHIFTPKQADIAACLGFRPDPLETVFERARHLVASPRELEDLLTEMQKNGGVEIRTRAGKRHYCNAPLVVGMYEFQLDRLTPEFLRDFDEYATSLRFGVAFLSADPPQMRTIPVSKSIRPQHRIGVFDDVAVLMSRAEGPFVVVECICRKKTAMEGHACKVTHRKETCLAIGDIARTALMANIGREISRGEALAVLAENQKEGLVLQPSNTRSVDFICSCCGCCCGMLQVHQLLPRPNAFWATNFHARVDAAACSGCGVCERRCQVGAIHVASETGTASVNAERCLGCGVCVPACPENAVGLVKNPQEKHLPETRDALYERIMANKKGPWEKWKLTARLFADALRTGRFRLLKGIGLLLALIVLVAGCDREPPSRFQCTDAIGCIEVGPGRPIRLGVLQALSGKIAPLGQEQVRGIRLALDARDGKLLGRAVVLRIEDTGCTAEGGANAALKVVADPETVAVLGTTCSAAAATAAKIVSDNGLVMISGNNSAPFLTSVNGRRAPRWQSGYFRTAPNEETSGQAAARFAFEELGIGKAATVHDGDIYTRGLTEGFESTFRELGGEIVLSAAVGKGDSEMTPLLTAVRDARARLLFFPLFQPEGNRVLLTARTLPGFADIVMMSDGALIETSFIESVGDAGKGMYFVGPARPAGPEVDRLDAVYRKTFGTAPSADYYLNAYDAADLLFQGIEHAAVREADGTLHIGRRALRDALYAMKDARGVTGALSCDAFGDCATPIFNILRLDDPAAGLDGLRANVMGTYTPK